MKKYIYMIPIFILMSFGLVAQNWTTLDNTGKCGVAPNGFGGGGGDVETLNYCFKSPFLESILSVKTITKKLNYPPDKNKPWKFRANIQNLTNSPVKIRGYYLLDGKRYDFDWCLKPNETLDGNKSFSFSGKYTSHPRNQKWFIEYHHPNSPCW